MRRRCFRIIAVCMAVGILVEQPLISYAAESNEQLTSQTTAEETQIGESQQPEEGQPSEGEQLPEEGQPGEGEQLPEEGQPGEGEQLPEEGQPGEGEQLPEEGEPGEGEQLPEEGQPGEGEQLPEEEQPGEGEQLPEEEQPGEGEQLPEEEQPGEGEQLPEEELPIEEEELLDADSELEKEKVISQEEETVNAVNGVIDITTMEGFDAQNANVAIQAALDSINATNHTVLIPSGTYKINAWLRINKSNTTLLFAEGAVLSSDGSKGIQVGGSTEGVRIEKAVLKNMSTGISIDSGARNVAVDNANIEVPGNASGIHIQAASGVEVSNCKINGGKLGILVQNTNTATIRNSSINNQTQGGIWVTSGNNLTIRDNTIKGGKEAGVWLENISNVFVKSNTITENGDSQKQTTYGLRVLSSGSNVLVEGNTITNNKKDGINIAAAAKGVSVKSNTIQANGAIGICVGGGSSVDITGNTIERNQDHGIILISSYGNIKNNKIDGSNSVGNVTRANHYGIIVSGRNAADKNQIIEVSNNTVNGMVGNGIQITGDKNNPNAEGAINVKVVSNQISNVKDNGITVNYNSHNAEISGNTVISAGVNGIDVQGGSSNCVVKNNIVESSLGMGINIQGKAKAEVSSNKVNAGKNAGIHLADSGTTVTVKGNQVTNHLENASIAAVRGAKANISDNIITMPMDYMSQKPDVVGYTLHLDDSSPTSNGAKKIQFKPDPLKTGDTKATGTGNPNMKITLTLNGSSKSAVIGNNWRYDIACNAAGAADVYQITADDNYGNSITFTNGGIVINGDEEAIKAFVERIYTIALNRPADVNGLKYWTNELMTGAKDGAKVAKGFIISPEMDRRNLSNEDFVTVLYRTFFDREPTANDSGRAFWINLLENGVSRAYVFRGFCHSQEFTNVCSRYGIIRGSIKLTDNKDQNHDITMYVYRCYDRTLGRKPDNAGLGYWTGQILTKKKKPTEVAGNFVFSKEFISKGYSDTEYIKIMYRMFFDRESDAAGLKFWQSEIDSGRRDRYKVFMGFANSKEFQAVLKKFGL